MKVYHGSSIEVIHPLVDAGRNNLDFGNGFYVTNLRDQAEKWARTIVRLRPQSIAKLNCYELDYETIRLNSSYRILHFEDYNEDWLDFVIDNRRSGICWKEYDLIEGGIANDRVFDTIENYIAGAVSKEYALGRLRYEKPNNQICILNQELIEKYLHWLECITLNNG